MIANLEYLRSRFETFNRECFGGELITPNLKINNARTMLGCVRFRKEKRLFQRTHYTGFTLSISAFYDLPQDALDDTILNEMIHLWILSKNIKDDSTHGTMFKKIMNEFNRRLGRHIKVSHKGKLQQSEQKVSQNLLAVTELTDGSIGITRASKSKIFELNRDLPRHFPLIRLRWYNSRNPYFNSFPRALTPKIYKANREVLEKELADAIPFKIEKDKIIKL